MQPVFLASPWSASGHSLNLVSLAPVFVSRMGGVIKKGGLGSRFREPGRIPYFPVFILHISGRGISAVAALVTDRMQLNARKHQDLNAKIPKSPGDSSKLSSNWERPKLIRSRASVNILHKLAPRTCRTERGCAEKKPKNTTESMK